MGWDASANTLLLLDSDTTTPLPQAVPPQRDGQPTPRLPEQGPCERGVARPSLVFATIDSRCGSAGADSVPERLPPGTRTVRLS
jgi:hypothetical protein